MNEFISFASLSVVHMKKTAIDNSFMQNIENIKSIVKVENRKTFGLSSLTFINSVQFKLYHFLYIQRRKTFICSYIRKSTQTCTTTLLSQEPCYFRYWALIKIHIEVEIESFIGRVLIGSHIVRSFLGVQNSRIILKHRK